MKQKMDVREFVLSEIWGKEMALDELKQIFANRNLSCFFSEGGFSAEAFLTEMKKSGLIEQKENGRYFAKVSPKEYREKGLWKAANAMGNYGSSDRMFFTPSGLGGSRPF
ncbi:MAG: hypothetical protein Q4F29_08895 [Lachnospiraceae bacterium]|nr:hypothetical protein [Lachnospiraceae bacterium]